MKKPILLAMLAAGICCAAQAPAPVKVEGGLLQGTSEDGLSVYRGIPFAAPPVGDLRWRAPQPAAKWEGVKQADKFGPPLLPGRAGRSRRRDKRGLPVPERVVAGEIGARPRARSGLDLRRWI
jgi:hypothetical protein